MSENAHWKADKIIFQSKFVLKEGQAIPGKKRDKPGDLEKSVKTRRLLAAPREVTRVKLLPE